MERSNEEMADAMEGIFAYDTGSVDSGIKDEMLREQVKAWLQTVDSKWLSIWVREAFLSDVSLAAGYRLEDVRSFIEWLSERMDCDI